MIAGACARLHWQVASPPRKQVRFKVSLSVVDGLFDDTGSKA